MCIIHYIINIQRTCIFKLTINYYIDCGRILLKRVNTSKRIRGERERDRERVKREKREISVICDKLNKKKRNEE